MSVLLVCLILVALALTLWVLRAQLSPMLVIRPCVTGPLSRFLSAAEPDAATLYERDPRFPQDGVVLPFGEVIMDRLELMAVLHLRDPQGLEYVGLEPQVFRLEDGRVLRRMLATTEQRDEADIYLRRGELALDQRLYRVSEQVGKVRDILEADFDRFEMSIEDTGLALDTRFTDRYGRVIEIKVDEQRLGRRSVRKGMIAPASLAPHDHYFPLLFLGQMSMVDRRSEVELRIDGVEQALLQVPFLGGEMIIYGRDTAGVYLFLTAPERVISVHRPEGGQVRLEQANFEEENKEHFQPSDVVEIVHRLHEHAGFSEIAESEYRFGGHTARLSFGPPLPAFLHLRDGARARGKLAISMDAAEGLIAGSYRVEREGAKVRLSLQLEDAYQPVGGDKWVSAYRWEAELRLDGEEVRLDGHWHKDRIVNHGLEKIEVVREGARG